MKISVDYEHHPAFGAFVNSASNDGVAGLITMTDAAINAEIRGRDRGGKGIASEQERFNRLLEADGNIEPSFKPFVAEAYGKAIDRARKEQVRRSMWGHFGRETTANARREAEKILHEGYTIRQMPFSTLQRLNQALLPDIEEMREIAEKETDDIIVKFPSNPEARTIVHDFCATSGIYDSLSAFFPGEKFCRAGFCIHYSHPNDTWFRVFDDISLEMPQTTQMHYDLEFSVPKAMLYLNDVGDQQGPFSHVPKRDPWESFDFDLALRKELLYGVSAYVPAKFGKSTAGNTSIFRFTEARRAFASLPKSLRETSHPGDHILDNTELSGNLLQSEVKHCGEAGTMPVFVGSHVLHRGGLVQKGERVALQICFESDQIAEAKRSTAWDALRAGIEKVKSRIS